MSEIYGLADQMKRAGVSIASNIAEGQARQGLAEFCHFLPVAKGSLAELDTQRIIAEELGFVSKNASSALGGLIIELVKMLYSLVARLKSSARSAEPRQLGAPASNAKSKR
jgi:four helix bundle protein